MKREKGYVAANIQYEVNSVVTSINKEGAISNSEENILPYGLRIEWTKETTQQAFMRNDEMIVRMDYHTNQDRNITIATLMYLSKGLLPNARNYINKTILRSMDLTVGKKILKKNPVSLDYFFREILDKEQEEVMNYCERLEDIDKAGLFTRILLREFRNLGRRLYPRQIRERKIPDETRDFVNFLREIAIKSREENVPLDFPGSKIKVGICLVAIPWRRDELEPHFKRINKYIGDKDIEEIYVFAAGKDNIKMAKEVVNPYKSHGLIRDIKKQEYLHEDYRDSGKTFPGICFTMIKGAIPSSIKIMIQALKEKSGTLVSASLTTIIRKNKGCENWPKPEYKSVYSCLEEAEKMSLIILKDSGGDKKVILTNS